MMQLKARIGSIVIGLSITAAVLVVGGPSQAATESMSLDLRSGQGPIGTLDPATEFSTDGGATYQPAVVISPHPAYSVLPGTGWVSISSSGHGAPGQLVRYRTSFELPAGFGDASIEVSVHADNAAAVYLNGTLIGQQPNAEIFENFQDPAESYSSSDGSLFGVGTNTLEFFLQNFGDPSGLDYLATVDFTVQVNEPPDCSGVTASPGELWPPNHKMGQVTVAGATDPDGDDVALSVTGVTQDEPVAGPGNNHSPDAASTDDPATVSLRAERDGTGDGRVYRISFAADDGQGGSCTGTALVGVPHDQLGDPAVDSGDSYDSFAA